MDYFLFNFSGVQFHYTMSLFKLYTHISPIDTLGEKMYSLIKVLAFISLLLF